MTTGLRESEALGLTWEDVNVGTPSHPGVSVEGQHDVVLDMPTPHRADRTKDVAASVAVRHTLHRIDGESR